jgi:hypothetical protein
MSRAALALAALCVFLCTAHRADGAATARILVFPSSPRVGQVATIQLRPFWLLAGTPPALAPANFPWTVAAISPRGRQLKIRLARSPKNPYVWSAVTRFRSRGSWTICSLNFSATGRACVPHSPGWQHVRVQAAGARTDVWAALERPFKIPTIAVGRPCPTTAAASKEAMSKAGFAGPSWGEGPAFPLLDGRHATPTIRYQTIVPGSPWLGEKVLWRFDPHYSGPVLIRGLQVDGPNDLRFDHGWLPPREMRISQTVQRGFRPSYTRVRASGCYGYQVDGVDFSYVIVFEARPL